MSCPQWQERPIQTAAQPICDTQDGDDLERGARLVGTGLHHGHL